jgi:plastocyanin
MGSSRNRFGLRVVLGLALGVGGPAAAFAGTITGTVTAKGPPVPAPSADGAYASHRYSLAERIDYAHLQDFVVYIDQAVGGDGPSAEGATVTQHDVGFEPHVLPIMVGTKVRWPNRDTIFHNVFSMSEIKPFDLGLYLQDQVPEIVFDKVGRVDVYCSIHAKMHCIILVLPSRYFAKSDANGHYVIRHVPPGTYRVKAWQERVPPSQPKEVAVSADGETLVPFVLGFSDLPSH